MTAPSNDVCWVHQQRIGVMEMVTRSQQIIWMQNDARVGTKCMIEAMERYFADKTEENLDAWLSWQEGNRGYNHCALHALGVVSWVPLPTDCTGQFQ